MKTPTAIDDMASVNQKLDAIVILLEALTGNNLPLGTMVKVMAERMTNEELLEMMSAIRQRRGQEI